MRVMNELNECDITFSMNEHNITFSMNEHTKAYNITSSMNDHTQSPPTSKNNIQNNNDPTNKQQPQTKLNYLFLTLARTGPLAMNLLSGLLSSRSRSPATLSTSKRWRSGSVLTSFRKGGAGYLLCNS